MDKLKTFKGGIHPPYRKEYTAGEAIRVCPDPQEVFIPLQQHIGAPCEPMVNPGDRVEVGQKIGDSKSLISAAVHSSVSGTVKGITEVRDFSGAKAKTVVIAADGVRTGFAKKQRDIESIEAGEIAAIAREAGLVGMGGAAFPVHVKLNPPADKPVDTVIINGCECEPFLTCDHRLMLERAADMIAGARLMSRAVGAKKIVIGVEANKMDAVNTLLAETKSSDDISVEVLEVKYPEGAEKMLICAVTGRKVPPGRLPSEVGCLVHNVGTAIALFEAAAWGKPLIDRVVTVTGRGIKKPANLLVKVGTPVSTLVEACGGYAGDVAKIIVGGPMTGWSQPDESAPVVKGTSGLIAFTSEEVLDTEERDCVNCGKCIVVCPMFLSPSMIIKSARRGQWKKAETFGALDCFECGCCTFECPAFIPHVKYVRGAKEELAAMKKA